MDNVFFDNPPVLQGDEKTQLKQLSGYLYTISGKLNEALMTVSAEAAKEVEQRITQGLPAEERKEYTALKSMIIKTAEIVRTEMDEISTQLHGETQAISSQFGELTRELDATIRATAEGVLQDYHYSETVRDAQTNTEYRTRTSQYIFSGLLDETTQEFGIAIGQNVTDYDSDGNPFLVQNAKVATFSMNRLAFWQGNTLMAYFSSGKFYIANGEITGTLQIGNYVWKSMTDQSMVLVRI